MIKPYKIRLRIENEIERLVKNPFPIKAEKLSGRPGYRLRIVDYQALYFIEEIKNTNLSPLIILNLSPKIKPTQQSELVSKA